MSAPAPLPTWVRPATAIEALGLRQLGEAGHVDASDLTRAIITFDITERNRRLVALATAGRAAAATTSTAPRARVSGTNSPAGPSQAGRDPVAAERRTAPRVPGALAADEVADLIAKGTAAFRGTPDSPPAPAGTTAAHRSPQTERPRMTRTKTPADSNVTPRMRRWLEQLGMSEAEYRRAMATGGKIPTGSECNR